MDSPSVFRQQKPADSKAEGYVCISSMEEWSETSEKGPPKIGFESAMPAAPLLPAPRFRHPTNTRRFETAETLGSGEVRMMGGREGQKFEKCGRTR